MKKPILILILIIFLALAFRIPAVLNSDSFWFDEVVSLEIAKHNIMDSWQYLQWENNPPVHYWFLHYWIKLFGAQEFALRFSSVLFSLFSLIAIYFLGKSLFSKRAGLFAAFLLAISSFQLHLSMDARMYPMLLFFSILSCYFLWQALSKSGKLNWILYTVFTLLALYTHLTAFFLLISQNLYFLYHNFSIKKNQPGFRLWMLNQAIIFILFAPWLITFVIRSLSSFNSGAWYLHTTGGGFLLFQLPRAFFFMGTQIPVIELIGLIIFAFLFILSLVKIYAWSSGSKEFKVQFNFQPATIFVFIIFAAPLLIGFIFQLWVAKYYTPAALGFYLILASGFNNWIAKSKYKISLIVLIFLLLLPYNLNMIKINQHAWHEAADYIVQQEQADDLILIAAFVYQLPFEHYYKGELEVIGYGPRELGDDLLLNAVKYNWYPVLTSENMPDLNVILYNKKRVFVVNPSVSAPVHNSNLVIDWFVENSWKLEHKEQFGGFIQPTVLIFERPE